MKILCECGQTIVDGESSRLKAHLLPDQVLFLLLDAMDEVIETAVAGAVTRESACMQIRGLLAKSSRSVWQCNECRRLYVERPDRSLESFAPSSASSARDALASEPQADCSGAS